TGGGKDGGNDLEIVGASGRRKGRAKGRASHRAWIAPDAARPGVQEPAREPRRRDPGMRRPGPSSGRRPEDADTHLARPVPTVSLRSGPPLRREGRGALVPPYDDSYGPQLTVYPDR